MLCELILKWQEALLQGLLESCLTLWAAWNREVIRLLAVVIFSSTITRGDKHDQIHIRWRPGCCWNLHSSSAAVWIWNVLIVHGFWWSCYLLVLLVDMKPLGVGLRGWRGHCVHVPEEILRPSHSSSFFFLCHSTCSCCSPQTPRPKPEGNLPPCKLSIVGTLSQWHQAGQHMPTFPYFLKPWQFKLLHSEQHLFSTKFLPSSKQLSSPGPLVPCSFA